jgi:hypothetical protein
MSSLLSFIGEINHSKSGLDLDLNDEKAESLKHKGIYHPFRTG